MSARCDPVQCGRCRREDRERATAEAGEPVALPPAPVRARRDAARWEGGRNQRAFARLARLRRLAYGAPEDIEAAFRRVSEGTK